MPNNTVKIITNNVPRPIIAPEQLSLSARLEFNYLDWEAIKAGNDSASFFRYKGTLYDLGEFQPLNTIGPAVVSEPFRGWHGYLSDSFFSGLVVRYTDDMEGVIVGTYYSS